MDLLKLKTFQIIHKAINNLPVFAWVTARHKKTNLDREGGYILKGEFNLKQYNSHTTPKIMCILAVRWPCDRNKEINYRKKSTHLKKYLKKQLFQVIERRREEIFCLIKCKQDMITK